MDMEIPDQKAVDSPVSNVWIVGYPKSGNTWLSYLVSYCLNLPYLDYGAPQKQPQRDWIREAVSGQQLRSSPKNYAQVMKTHMLPEEISQIAGQVFYIQRDPRDVFVSTYYFMKMPSAGIWGRLRFNLLGLLGRKSQIRWFIKHWLNHVRTWHSQQITTIQYEQLLARGSEYLQLNLKKAGFEVESNIVSTGIETFSFENLSGGRKAGESDNRSFFRRGVAGDHQQFLTADEQELFRNLAGKYLQS